MAASKITINVIHPTDSAEILTASVSTSATPRFLIDQMIQTKFLPVPANASLYKLRVAQTGQQLIDNVTLADAGLPDNTTIAVDHATTGAAGRAGSAR